jgi:hypothetical protein
MPEFTDAEYQQHSELKTQGLERVLGEMYHLVNHAIIPFKVGGTVDMYFFLHAMPGTGFVTMELIEPDGSGPQPSEIGTYELVAFTMHKVGDEADKEAFRKIERRMCGIFTSVASYSYEACLNPLETIEVPDGKNKPYRCLLIDKYENPGVPFTIGNRAHGLLLLVEVFRCEMEYAMTHGTQTVIDMLTEKGYYPYSDLDRKPVV